MALDYEFLWFANPTTPKIRKAYRDWFIESAELVRETAAALGAEGRIKIVIIVNTDPYEYAQTWIGAPALPVHKPQRWILDCVRAADIFAIDTYAGGNAPKVSAKSQLEVIDFWTKYYALNRPVFVTESGCSSSREHGDLTRGYHLRGTEAEQAVFFQEMFSALENRKKDSRLRRLSGYCIWSYIDDGSDPSRTEGSFGLRRKNGEAKPVFHVVSEGIARIEKSSKNAPVRENQVLDVTAELNSGKPVALSRLDGVSYDTLRFLFTPEMDSADPYFLELNTSSPVSYIARIGESPWISSLPNVSSHHRIDLGHLAKGKSLQILVNFTAPVFPVKTQLLSAAVKAK